MALLLQPGDPLPAPAADAAEQVPSTTGRWLLLWAGASSAPAAVADLTVVAVAVEGETARRLGVESPQEHLSVLVEPGGTVHGSWSGADAGLKALDAFSKR